MSEPRGWSPRTWGGWGVEPGDDGDADSAQIEQWATLLGEGCDYVSLSLPRDMLIAQLSQIFAQKRAQMGLSQLRLASLAWSNIQTISQLERRVHLPKIPCLSRLALALGYEPLLVFLPRTRDPREIGE